MCVRGGRRVGGGVTVVVEVSNGEEQWEGILITPAAAPALSTYETDRAKHQLMQWYPHGEPARSHLDSQQQPPDYGNDRVQPRDADGRRCFSAVLSKHSALLSYPDYSTKDVDKIPYFACRGWKEISFVECYQEKNGQ